MNTISISTVVGARPQFVKAAAVSRAITQFHRQQTDVRIEESIIHTGQHYDHNMSQVFFDHLQIPRPTINLEIGSESHGKQTGAMLEGLESVLQNSRPDWVLIYGDTNSTLAAALAAAKLHIPIAHVEAGLRSFNRRMPEEINRIVADTLSSLLFCPTDNAVRNLAGEGITAGVHLVGDVMYDSVLFHSELAAHRSEVLKSLHLEPKTYYLATVHRAENTDAPGRMDEIVGAFANMDLPVVWPLHPRTRSVLSDNLKRIPDTVRIVDPMPYLDMLMLEKNAKVVLTDSGGVQKEAYWFQVPCVTLRAETEWAELVEAGINRLCDCDTEAILSTVASIGPWPRNTAGDLYGCGNSSMKILATLANWNANPLGTTLDKRA